MAYLGVKTVDTCATSYRLAKKPDGTLVLQGAFKWQRRTVGTSETQGLYVGIEWIDIPTVEIEDDKI